MKHNRTNRFAVAVLAAVLAWVAPATDAHAAQTKEAGSDFGIGMVAVLANVVYMPVKVTYGILGGVTGGFAYVLSGANRDVADGVWVPSLGGDYVLTTDMMTGRERVHFNGVRGRPASEDKDGRLGDTGSSASF
ncbi:MAG TPA: hypothetical protein VN634_11850 [Candidatus Limnocylindrales bacterium]|nr:hypothetical protein [Candidatus Limnocylindrales bacterium]